MATEPSTGESSDSQSQDAAARAEAAAKRAEQFVSQLAVAAENAAKAEEAAKNAAANATQSEEAAKAAAKAAATLSGEIAPTNQQAKASLEAAAKASGEIPPLVEGAKRSSTEIPPLVEQIKGARDEIIRLLEASKTESAKTAEIARVADEKDKRVKEYEKKLGELSGQHDKLYAELYALLPAATGVGLAKSFHSRKQSLRFPISVYFFFFLISIIGFVVFGWYGLFVEKIATLEEFFKFLLERSPIFVGLILLEEFSRRQYSATTKLREDYAYKETISIAFDGYKKAMLEVQSSPADSLATQFSKSVIAILHERPGRLLEHEEKHILPVWSLLEQSSSATEKGEKGAIAAAIESARNAISGLWFKGISIGLIVLAIGLGVGYYFASRNTGTHIEVPGAVNPPPAASSGAKK